MTLDQLVAQGINRPQHNIYGDLGPRCIPCSGLGSVIRPRIIYGETNGGAKCESLTRCTCEGSGLDIPLIERMDREMLWQQIHALESRMGQSPTSRYKFPNIKMSRQFWMETIAWATSDGTAVASSTTETILFPNVTIPANYLQDGRGLRIKAAGKYSTLGSGTVSHVYAVRWGGVAGSLICKTGTITLLISMVNAFFTIEVMIQTRSNGSAGTILGDGEAIAYGGTAPTIGSATGAPAVSPMTNGGQTVPAVAPSTDLTADTALSLTLTHGANSATNTATGQHYTIESMN